MYFYYGIKHSSLEECNSDCVDIGENAGNIELTITEHSTSSQPQEYLSQDRHIYETHQLDAFGQPVFGNMNFGGSPNIASSDKTQSQSKPLFVPQDSFPTWDD